MSPEIAGLEEDYEMSALQQLVNVKTKQTTPGAVVKVLGDDSGYFASLWWGDMSLSMYNSVPRRPHCTTFQEPQIPERRI